MKVLSLITLLVLCVGVNSVRAQGHSLDHSQYGYIELGGLADFWSLNYERVLKVNEGSELSAWTGRVGVGPNLGKFWSFATINYLKESGPIFDKQNIFTEFGVGPILRRDFGIKKWDPYFAGYVGMRQHPTDASPWLLKADLYLVFLRNTTANAGFLGYVFPTAGFTIGRSF